jgi:CBS domain-containing protein
MTTVVDAAGSLVGIITDGDLRRGLERSADIRTLGASDLMTHEPRTIERSALAAQAVAAMERARVSSHCRWSCSRTARAGWWASSSPPRRAARGVGVTAGGRAPPEPGG